MTSELKFLEGDFDSYVMQMRQPHIWSGEPELVMTSHVLQMPITVYMRDQSSGSIKIIAGYGKEYGKENPIRVLVMDIMMCFQTLYTLTLRILCGRSHFQLLEISLTMIASIYLDPQNFSCYE